MKELNICKANKLLSGWAIISNEKLVTSNEFFITKWIKMNNLDRKLTNPLRDRLDRRARSAHNELVTSYSLLVTRTAFTMAEILLSLTIIGVVAAITLPSLTGNINERTWNTQRKALYSRISQAISLMPALNNYGTLDDTTDNAAETFITSGLSKVLKINNICDNNYQDCGIVTSYHNMTGTKKAMPTTLYEFNTWFYSVSGGNNTRSYHTNNTKAAAFETQNGESIIAYYNRSCITQYLNQDVLTTANQVFGFPEANMCLNFVYDLNGKKGPNTVGKDIGFITVFNATDSIIVAPMPTSSASEGRGDFDEVRNICKETGDDNRVPNVHELASLFFNKDFINLDTQGKVYSSSSVFNSYTIWNISHGVMVQNVNDAVNYVRCIKRN